MVDAGATKARAIEPTRLHRAGEYEPSPGRASAPLEYSSGFAVVCPGNR